jgi:hypothetical protein
MGCVLTMRRRIRRAGAPDYTAGRTARGDITSGIDNRESSRFTTAEVVESVT